MPFWQKCPLLGNLVCISRFFFRSGTLQKAEFFCSSFNTTRRFFQGIKINYHTIFLFLNLLRRKRQSWQGTAPGSKPTRVKQSAAPDLRAVWINPEWYQGVKKSKFSIIQKHPRKSVLVKFRSIQPKITFNSHSGRPCMFSK